jgi:hypothetical protein
MSRKSPTEGVGTFPPTRSPLPNSKVAGPVLPPVNPLHGRGFTYLNRDNFGLGGR